MGNEKSPTESYETPEVLRQAYLRRKALKPAFTLRKFAILAGVSPPYLTAIMKGKRRLPLSKLDLFGDLLDLDSEKRNLIFREITNSREPRAGLHRLIVKGKMPDRTVAQKISWVFPNISRFWVLERWYFLPILDFTLVPGFDGSALSISKRLGLSLEIASDALTKLHDAGYLVRKNGKLQKGAAFLDFNTVFPKQVLRQFHLICMDKAKYEIAKRVSDSEAERRFLSTASFTMNRDDLPWVKQKLRDCLDEIIAHCGSQQRNDVYQLGIQLIPLTPSSEVFEGENKEP